MRDEKGQFIKVMHFNIPQKTLKGGVLLDYN